LLYYLKASYRRRLLDKLLRKHADIYKGIVLDIGGRDRGQFIKPRTNVERWIFADINTKHNPDLVLDVADMKQVKSESIDVVNATELFEHVEKIDDGISECHRVLKQDGKILITVPFLYPVHADPFDFQRWTLTKWKNKLGKMNFSIERIEIMGRYFNVINETMKTFINSLPIIVRHLGYLLLPFFDLTNKLDTTNWIKNHPKLGNYHGGYFIVARKND